MPYLTCSCLLLGMQLKAAMAFISPPVLRPESPSSTTMTVTSDECLSSVVCGRIFTPEHIQRIHCRADRESEAASACARCLIGMDLT